MKDFITNWKSIRTQRAELRPFAESAEFLKPAIERACKIKDQSRKVKPFLDLIHRVFLEKELSILHLDTLGFNEAKPLIENYLSLLMEIDKSIVETDPEKIKKIKKEHTDKKREYTYALNGVLRKVAGEMGAIFKKSEMMNTFHLDKDNLFFASENIDSLRHTEPFRSIIETNDEYRTGFDICNELSLNYYGDLKEDFEIRCYKYDGVLSSHTIANRILNDNLFIYINNIHTFRKIRENADFKEFFLSELEKLTPYFSMDSYEDFISQLGIDQYNDIINGHAEIGQDKTPVQIKGINAIIREYNSKNNLKGKTAVPEFSKLQKMILCISERSFKIAKPIMDDKDMTEELRTLAEEISKDDFAIVRNIVTNSDIDKFEKDDIIIKFNTLGMISKTLFNDPLLLRHKTEEYESNHKTVKKGKKGNSNVQAFTLQELEDMDVLNFYQLRVYLQCISNNMFKARKSIDRTVGEILDLCTEIEEGGIMLRSDEKAVSLIESFIITCNDFTRRISIFVEKKNEDEFSKSMFYENFSGYYSELNALAKNTLNRVRNYLLKKPDSKGQIQLKFGFKDLGSTWAESRLVSNGMLIFFDEERNRFILGIKNKFSTVENKNEKFTESARDRMLTQNDSTISLLRMQQVADARQVLGKLRKRDGCAQLLDDKFKNSEQCNDLIKRDHAALTEYIDWCKKAFLMQETYKRFDFEFKESDEYTDFQDFLNDLMSSSYSVSLQKVDREMFDGFVKSGELLAFEIYTKDLYALDKANRSLSGQYIYAALTGVNGVALAAGADIFYRPALQKAVITHPKGSWLLNKKDKDGNDLLDENGKNVYIQLYKHLNGQETNTELFEKWKDRIVYFTAKKDYLKDNRFFHEHFELHLPVYVNKTGPDPTDKKAVRKCKERLNSLVEKVIREDDYNILTISKGRDIINMMKMDKDGNVIFFKSLDILENGRSKSNFADSLQKRADFCQSVRTSLKNMAAANAENTAHDDNPLFSLEDNIKNIKTGYLSNIVYIVSQQMKDGRTFLVMDDLNNVRKNRSTLDTDVCMDLQVAILTKLSYLTDKRLSMGTPGSVNMGISLAMPALKNGCFGRNGFVFFITKSYLNERIDPKTGYVNIFGLSKNGLTVKEAKTFFSKFKKIRYNAQKDVFEFTFSYGDVMKKENILSENPLLAQHEWTIASVDAKRVEVERDEINGRISVREADNICESIKHLLDKAGIKYKGKDNILKELVESAEMKSSPLHSLSILFSRMATPGNYFRLRNTKLENFSSPAEGGYQSDEKGCLDYISSRNLALKGLTLIRKIQKAEDNEFVYGVTVDEWVNTILSMKDCI